MNTQAHALRGYWRNEPHQILSTACVKPKHTERNPSSKIAVRVVTITVQTGRLGNASDGSSGPHSFYLIRIFLNRFLGT